MKKYYSLFLLVFGSALVLSSCYEEPDFALEPHLVDFDGDNGIRFVDVPNTVADSLIFRVLFQDGNGDLGLYSNESNPILSAPYFYNLDENNELIVFDPNDGTEFDCVTWAEPPNYIRQDTINDTLSITRNPYYSNFDVGIYKKEEGVYQEFDLLEELCRARLGGRFPPLKDDFSNTKPLEGVIEYGIASAGLLSLFRNDTLKFTVQIRDRALNESNVIESRPIVLRSEGSIYVDE